MFFFFSFFLLFKNNLLDVFVSCHLIFCLLDDDCYFSNVGIFLNFIISVMQGCLGGSVG